MDNYDHESHLLRNILIVLGALTAVALLLWALIRTERRLYRFFGVIKGRMPVKKEKRQFHIELHDI